MSKRMPKTTGTEWLYLSMASFNGSGYADKSSPENYYKSYIMYKAWKKQPLGVGSAKLYKAEAMVFAETLCEANEPGITPSKKNMEKFLAFKERSELLI